MKDLFGEKELRALSWKEPFASLMLHGKIETRTWSTNYRGRVLICASKAPYNMKNRLAIMGFSNHMKVKNMGLKLFSGQAIAVGDLVDCRPMTRDDEAATFVKYKDGLYCHVYENVRAIEPIPIKGQQGWKKLPSDFVVNLL